MSSKGNARPTLCRWMVSLKCVSVWVSNVWIACELHFLGAKTNLDFLTAPTQVKSRLKSPNWSSCAWMGWIALRAAFFLWDLSSCDTSSWVNLVVPKNWVAYFSAISGRKLDLTTVLRSCWPREWRRRGFLASGPFFSLFLTFAHEKNHFPVVKSGFWGHISH